MPPIEAIACGTPAVVSNIPALTETTCGLGLTADPDDPRTWVKAFETLEDQEFYQFKAKTGLEWVEHLKGPVGWRTYIADIKAIFQGDSYIANS